MWIIYKTDNCPVRGKTTSVCKKSIFVPKGNRCCLDDLIKKRLFEDQLQQIRVYSNTSTIEVDDLHYSLNDLSVRSESAIIDKIGDFTLSEHQLQVFTGLQWENIIELRAMLTSMKNSTSRSSTQAIVTFLFKLRTGNSNKVIASILGLERDQQVSDFSTSVLQAFEKDVLPGTLDSIHFLIQN